MSHMRGAATVIPAFTFIGLQAHDRSLNQAPKGFTALFNDRRRGSQGGRREKRV